VFGRTQARYQDKYTLLTVFNTSPVIAHHSGGRGHTNLEKTMSKESTDLTELTLARLSIKREGHHKFACAFERKTGKRELYLHHIEQWVEVNEEIKRRKLWKQSKARQVFGD
jgi:hypothetical protein